MAKCVDCGKEMTIAYGCSVKFVYINGERFPRVCVGDSGDFLENMPRYCRCHDCNAMVGFFHHGGCDAERCPKCGGQLLSCSCNGVIP